MSDVRLRYIHVRHRHVTPRYIDIYIIFIILNEIYKELFRHRDCDWTHAGVRDRLADYLLSFIGRKARVIISLARTTSQQKSRLALSLSLLLFPSGWIS